MDIRLPLLTFANVYSLHGNDYLLPLLLFLLLPFVHFVSFRLVHFVRSLGRSICITFVFKPIPEIEWPISISNRQVENCFTGCDPNRVNCYLAAHLTTNKKKQSSNGESQPLLLLLQYLFVTLSKLFFVIFTTTIVAPWNTHVDIERMIVELTVEPPSMWPFKSNQIEHRQCYPIDATFIIIPWSTISIGNVFEYKKKEESK